MPRPRKCRWVMCNPRSVYFKPRGTPLAALEEVILTVDEFEALRLADLEGMSHEQAASRMKISRQTFGRTVERARKIVTAALVSGKAIKIEGGNYIMKDRIFRCTNCGHVWGKSYGKGRPDQCPKCGGVNITRASENRDYARGCGKD